MKRLRKLNALAFILMAFLMYSCNTEKTNAKSENSPSKSIQNPLPSWNEGETKTAIITYVNAVSNKNSADFIEVKDRIATFDNDGNLWSEQPAYFQLFFAIDRVKAMAADHPEWKNKQPFKAVLENDMEALAKQGEHGLLQLVMATHAGNTTEEFKADVQAWIKTAMHPTKKVTYDQLVYQPMLELLEYLRANDFKTYVVSGGGVDFMRAFVTEIYGIPEEQIIGSRIKTAFDYNNGNPVIKRLPELDFIDDKEVNHLIFKRSLVKNQYLLLGILMEICR